MTSSADELIKEGHKAIKRGEKIEARQLLQQAAEQNPADYRAWLGLAAVARTPRESLVFIEKAAELKPDNPAVHQARQWAKGLAQKQAQAETKAQAITVPTPKTLPRRETPIQERPKVEKTATLPEAATLPTRPAALLPPVKTPVINRGLALRRIVAVAAIMGLIIAMGIVTWVAYTSFLNSFGLAANNEPSAVSTPNAAEIALVVEAVPEAQVSNILPEKEPEVVAVASATATPNPLQPKNIVQEDSSNPRARWTVTPLPTQTPTPSPTWVPTFVSPISEDNLLKPIGLLPNERWIDVDLSDQSLIAFEGDTPVFETLVSTGLPNHPTVIGQFRIWLRYTSQTMDGSRLGYNYYLEGVPYVQYFYEDYALHGTYWHNNFGHPMSHGCVNLSTPDSEWLYSFADYGTVVNVHE